jgi:hypothetical protein
MIHLQTESEALFRLNTLQGTRKSPHRVKEPPPSHSQPSFSLTRASDPTPHQVNGTRAEIIAVIQMSFHQTHLTMPQTELMADFMGDDLTLLVDAGPYPSAYGVYFSLPPYHGPLCPLSQMRIVNSDPR